jgi:pimeloyl-ACP methyl ester carboxylesterase
MNVAGPYIVVSHSWGGILSREFLNLRGEDVVGMVFVDPNMERTFERPEEFPYQCVEAIGEGIDVWDITGERVDNVLAPEEFEMVVRSDENPRMQATQAAEKIGFKGSFSTLAEKKQLENHSLGRHAVSVIAACWTGLHFQRTLDEAVRRGNGTREERADYQAFVDDWIANGPGRMREIICLSSQASLRFFRMSKKSGHNVQMIEPGLIVEEIKRVWDLEVKTVKKG